MTRQPPPASGFAQPFEMLAACHERVARMLDLLARLHEHLMRAGADDQAQQAARDVMRYFDLAAPAHHEDEERHVLPRLREIGQSALAERLHAEHAAMAALWSALRTDLLGVAAGRRPDDAELPARWESFAASYRRHIALEDEVALPAAARGLAPPQLDAMGREMAGRRGL